MTSRQWPSSSSALSVKRPTSSQAVSQGCSTIRRWLTLLLLDERLHARAMISGSDCHCLIGDSRVYDGSGNPFQLQVYEYLRPPDCVAGTLEEALAERVDRAVELGGGDTMVDETDLLRLLCCQQLAGQEVFLRSAEADGLLAGRRPPVPRNGSEGHVRITDPGVLRSE